jgi:Fe-S cluster assembly protein SufD
MSGAIALGLPEARRNEAASLFRARGVPHRRVEAWKYSDLRAALGDAGFGAGTAEWRVGTLPAGVELFDLAKADAPEWVKAHLGTMTRNVASAASLTHAAGGVALRVRGVADAPLALEFSGVGHVRALIVLETGAALTLLESQSGSDAALRNTGIEIVLAADAELNHVRLAPVAAGAVRVEEIGMRVARDARYRAHYASFGARLSRLELDIALEGENAQAHLSGVSVLSDEAHADVTTHVRHLVGRTQSTQLFKNVAGGKSRAVYQGKVSVAKDADGSDSRQSAKALLLGSRAEADLKPELEILADDVKCAHGAAVGDLDAESLFYLRARGIPENEARAMLIHAFLEDAVSEILADDLRVQVQGAVETALAEISA